MMRNRIVGRSLAGDSLDRKVSLQGVLSATIEREFDQQLLLGNSYRMQLAAVLTPNSYFFESWKIVEFRH